MDIDPAEARAALEEAKILSSRMKKALKAFGAAYHFIAWGTLWLIGFLIMHFADRLPRAFSTWHWLVLNVIGNAFSLTFSFRARKAFKPLPRSGIGLIWVLYLCFAFLGSFFVQPEGAKEAAMLIILALMLLMSIIGAILYRALVWVAVGIAALGALSYWLAPDAFYLCLAIGGGGAIIVTGLFLLKRSGE
jgi:hypothetical protein